MSDDRILSVQDVYNAFAEHMTKLDQLWPDGDPTGPRKIHIVELMDAIKLRLAERARKNLEKYESPFERAAKKITGTQTDFSKVKQDKQQALVPDGSKTAMQLAHEAAQQRMRR